MLRRRWSPKLFIAMKLQHRFLSTSARGTTPRSRAGNALIYVLAFTAVAMVTTLALMDTVRDTYKSYRATMLDRTTDMTAQAITDILSAPEACQVSLMTDLAGNPTNRNYPTEAAPFAIPNIRAANQTVIYSPGAPDASGVGIVSFEMRPHENSDAKSVVNSKLKLADLVVHFQKSGSISGPSESNKRISIALSHDSSGKLLGCRSGVTGSGTEINNVFATLGRCYGAEFVTGVDAAGHFTCGEVEKVPRYVDTPITRPFVPTPPSPPPPYVPPVEPPPTITYPSMPEFSGGY